MIPSQWSLRLAASAGLVLVAGPAPELRVLRVVPAGEASPTAAVTITFDRPVAGSLDRTVEPGAIFRIEPAAGKPTLAAAAQGTPPPLSGQGFLWPVNGKVVGGFGPIDQGQRRDGIDIAEMIR